jgi:hypothetical protein
MDQPGEPPTSSLLIAISTGQFSLIPGLFLKQCIDEASDRSELMALSRRRQLFDLFPLTSRVTFRWLPTDRISQVAGLYRYANLLKMF